MVGCLPIIELRSEVAQSWGWAELFRLTSVGEDSAYFLDQGISVCLFCLECMWWMTIGKPICVR